MPRVPTYDGPQVRQGVTPQVQLTAPDTGRNTRAAVGGLNNLAEAFDHIQARDDQDAAFRAEAQIKADWIDYESKLREQRKGRDAATYDTEVDQWWRDASQKYGADLSPGAKRLIGRSLMASQLQAVAGAKGYKEQQLNASAEASYQAAQGMAINEAATVGNEAAATTALAGLAERRAERARLQGWTPEQTKADEMAWASTLHSVVLSKMMRADPAAAQVYFDKYKGQIAANKQAEIESHLQQTSAALDATNTATDLWASLGPKADGQPVEIDKMEQAARDRFKGDPMRMKATIDELRQRAVAHNQAENERTAGRTNTVMEAYSRGATLGQLRAMPEFQALGGSAQSKIVEHITDRNHMLWARSIEDRARLEREQQSKTFPAFLEYSNPDTLAGMSRAQVQALLPSLGNDLTQHLVNKWDGLQKSGGKLEARIDTEDFNHIADQMGLAPYKANTEDKKRQIGELKFKVEQLIDQAQQVKKAPLTREEKNVLMRNELARTVTVPGFLGFGSEQVPVIQLTPDQAAKVEVPASDREQIAAALKTMYAQTGNAMYAPTEENMRKLYLANQSRAAGLIAPKK